MSRNVLATDSVLPFRGSQPCEADEPAQRRVACPIGCENDETQALHACELATDDELDRQIARSRMRTHAAGHRTFVRECKPGIAKLCRSSDELIGMGSATQKRKVAETMQLCVIHRDDQPNMPCRYQRVETQS